MMEVFARHNYAPISAQKARLVANQIRGVLAEEASAFLNFSINKSAFFINKILNSAIANAEHNNSVSIDELVISKVYVNEGPTKKSFRARARGRGNQILKRSCHITVVVSDKK